MRPLLVLTFTTLILSAITATVDLKDTKNRDAHFLTSLLTNAKNLKLQSENEVSPDMCEKRVNPLDPNYFYFLPVFKAKLYKAGDSIEFTAGCFKHNVATLVEFSQEKTVIEITASDPASVLCSDIYLIHTSSINHLTSIFAHGKHEIILKNLSQDDMDEIKMNSIKILGFCQGLLESLKSIFMSLKMFVGGLGYNPDHIIPILRPHVPDYMIKSNLEMLQLYNNWQPLPREDIVVDLDESEIHTGDFVAISRLDGVDPIIMIGTGTRIGHSAVCAWIDGELYVIESQDGWYWPYKGIQRNKYKEWVRLAHIAEFNVAILPMKEEVRKRFNTEAAIAWYKNGIEGLNYGYHTFLFSWIDTPDKNLPFMLAHEHFEFLFTTLEKISPSLGDKMMGEAVNKRLGTSGLTIAQGIAEGARQGKSFEDLLAMPEQDGWEYSDGLNYVCSCFVVAFYKAGGLFDGLDIQANEFTPRDVYMLNFFDTEYKKPQACIDADPDLPYCQIMGKFKVDLTNEYSTVEPYTHMNESCPSIGPDFIRESGC